MFGDSICEDLGLEIRETNKRLDGLSEVIVHREEHTQVVKRSAVLERDVAEMKRRLAA
jgi:hypothetical protein